MLRQTCISFGKLKYKVSISGLRHEFASKLKARKKVKNLQLSTAKHYYILYYYLFIFILVLVPRFCLFSERKETIIPGTPGCNFVRKLQCRLLETYIVSLAENGKQLQLQATEAAATCSLCRYLHH